MTRLRCAECKYNLCSTCQAKEAVPPKPATAPFGAATGVAFGAQAAGGFGQKAATGGLGQTLLPKFVPHNFTLETMFQRLPDGTYWKSKVVNRELTFEKVRGDEERCSALFARLTLQQEAEHLEAERRRERERERERLKQIRRS